MIHFSDAVRRRRLVRRHHLGRTAGGVEEAVKAVAAQHSSDPVTPYLAAWARVPGFGIADLDRELLERRTVWRMHTVRRTLFLVPAADVPAFEAGAAREIARRERRRLAGWLSAEMDPAGVDRWLADAGARVLEALGGDMLGTRELSARVPELKKEVTLGAGKWTSRAPVSSRLLFLLALEGLIVRGPTSGSWRTSQYRWTTVEHWNGGALARPEEREGRREVARQYLASHGPATLADLRWWSGWTVQASRQALADTQAVTVELDSGEPGWVLPDDAEPEPGDPGDEVALLPALDSTPMGWKQRDWYLGAYERDLFDSNGNAGPTVWAGGRVVGGWAQRDTGEVVFALFEEVGASVAERIAAEARALARWMDGVVALPRFPTPLTRRLGGG